MLTKVAHSIELYFRNRTRTKPFPKVYSKSLCVYGSARLSRIDERSMYSASKFHRNRPLFHIRIGESIKSNLVFMYSILHIV